MGAKIIYASGRNVFARQRPQKANEIMLPQNYIDFLGESYRPGDTITFDVTGTGDEAEYTLSGVLNEDRKSEGYFVYLSKDLAMS